jgi:hypothetical protein
MMGNTLNNDDIYLRVNEYIQLSEEFEDIKGVIRIRKSKDRQLKFVGDRNTFKSIVYSIYFLFALNPYILVLTAAKCC